MSLQLESDGGSASTERDLMDEGNGYWSSLVPEVGHGTAYRFRLDGREAYADPASRYQPTGPHGPSMVVDPGAFSWTDAAWPGLVDPARVVLYEMHVGTFTPEGTWSAAAERLPLLRELGVTAIEMMPVADFPGDFGWGYDGVLPFAPYHAYGAPDDLRAFVDAAHGMGIGVLLDVVYNHFGPDGNVLGAYSLEYFSREHVTDWGDAPNFDGAGSEHVRTYFLANVRHWIEEYHFDGFRFDATQDIRDCTAEHILTAMSREARAAAGTRAVFLVGENEPQDTRLLRASRSSNAGLDALGNDDFHHTAVVAATGRRQAYYQSHRGTPQELLSALKHGFLYQGQWYPWQGQRRGRPTRGHAPTSFLHCLENHDQVANQLRGERLHRLCAPATWRALVAVQLLGPQTPLIFQGQEFASSAPFRYFAHQPPDLAEQTRRGRTEALSEFEDLDTPESVAAMSDPADPRTFSECKLAWGEYERNGHAVRLHKDLLDMRRTHAAFAGTSAFTLDGAVLASEAFLVRWRAPLERAEDERLLLVNLGRELRLTPAPEPLLAPPSGVHWGLVWSSEDPVYGGSGTPPVETDSWNLPARSALVMAPVASEAALSPDDASAPARPWSTTWRAGGGE